MLFSTLRFVTRQKYLPPRYRQLLSPFLPVESKKKGFKYVLYLRVYFTMLKMPLLNKFSTDLAIFFP